MQINAIHHAIAERELEHGDGHAVRIIVGQPEPFPDGRDFSCPFHIIGLAGDKIRRAGGIDSVQALKLALTMIGAILYTSDEYKAGQLTWNESKDLGFPVQRNLRDLLPPNAENF